MDQSDAHVHARIAYLERTVIDLQRSLQEVRATLGMQNPLPVVQPTVVPVEPSQVAPGTDAAPRPLAPLPPAPPLPTAATPARPVGGADIVRGGEYWFSRIGIGLLLLGLAFLFKYAVDQGWLTPSVRVGIGVFAGAALLATGLWLRERRSWFAAILQGGGVAAWYITDFAAFQLYELVNYPLAFGCMCAITLLTFALAVWQNGLALAIIAAIGGLATPFVLYTDSGSVTGLVLYTSFVLSGIAAICVYRRWRPLLWVGGVGGWLVLFSAFVALQVSSSQPIDRWVTQGGIIWISLLFWPLVVAVARSTRSQSDQASASALFYLSSIDGSVAAFVTPFLALGLSVGVWELSQMVSGWLALGLAGITIAGWWLLRHDERGKTMAYAHAGTAVLLFTTALLLLLEGNALLLALAVEAAALHWLAGRHKDWPTAGFAHTLFAGLTLALLWRFVVDSAQTPIFVNLSALTTFAVIGLLFASSWVIYPRQLSPIYWLTAHLLLLGALAHQLLSLDDGNGYVTMVWGVYGAVLLLVGLRWDRTASSLFGMGTLLLVVTKLLLVDLSSVAAIWRILLFMGFGLVFLVFGYFLRALWRPKTSQP